MNSAYDRLKFF